MKTHREETAHVRELLNEFSTAMLITHGLERRLHARPMAIADIGENLELWFVSGEDSIKIHEIESDTRAHVVCQKDQSAHLSLSGTATVERDRARVEQLWKEAFRVWFPKGKDDPNLVLIRFTPEHAEFWDNTGFNKIAYLWDAARAYVTGTQPEVRDDAHGSVSLN